MRKQKLEDFCKFHNITLCHLSKLAGVNPRSMAMYANGELGRKSVSATRIEIAMQVIEDFGLIYESADDLAYNYANDANRLKDSFAKGHIRRIIIMEIG